MKKLHVAVVAGAIAALGLASAFGAGFATNGLIAAGGTGQAFTLPITGLETAAFDTNFTTAGINPATEAITTAQLGAYAWAINGAGSFRNLLVCGDFNACPWQRGTTVSADIANTVTYYADQWWNIGAAGSAIDVTQVTTSQVTGLGASLKFQRKSANTDVNAICMGQVLPTQNSLLVQGQLVELSYWAKAGATFSPTSSNVNVTIGTGTGTNETPANFTTAAWTGASNTAVSQVITTTWTRYSMVKTVAATATQIGVQFCFTPVGTAGATDQVEFAGIQLDINPSAVALSSSGTIGYASAFERRPASVEAALAQRFFYRIVETNGGYFAAGMVTATNVENAVLPLPVTMRAIPTCTFTAGGLSWDLNATDTAVTTLTCSAASTPSIVTIGDTTTGTAGWTGFLKGTATSGRINVTAEL